MADNSPHPSSSAAPDLGELADLWTEMNAKRAAIDNKIAREARALEAERAEAKDLSREADDLKARHAEVAEVTHRVREGNRLDEERIEWLEGHMEKMAEGFRAIREAELELAGKYSPSEHADMLARLDGFQEYIYDHVTAKRRDPQDDMISFLCDVHYEALDRKLTDLEIAGIVHAMILGGLETGMQFNGSLFSITREVQRRGG